MTGTERRPDFWETAGAQKTFTHPFDPELFGEHVRPDARILDYGCGYGRLLDELERHGFRDAQGADPSAALIARGRRTFPGLRLIHAPGIPLPHPDGTFDAVTLFAVLCVIPGDAAQHALVAEVSRLLRPGGVVYVSDVPLQSSEREQARYRAHHTAHGGTFGVFETHDGGVFRHHAPDRLPQLLAAHGFAVSTTRTRSMATLNGHSVTGVQLLARQAGPPGRGGRR